MRRNKIGLMWLWRASSGRHPKLILDFTRLVFVDETGANTAMTRSHGWRQKGKKLFAKAPHGHWMTSTFVAGLVHDGGLSPEMAIRLKKAFGVRMGTLLRMKTAWEIAEARKRADEVQAERIAA